MPDDALARTNDFRILRAEIHKRMYMPSDPGCCFITLPDLQDALDSHGMVPQIMGSDISPPRIRDIYAFMLPFLSFVVCIGAEAWLAQFAHNRTELPGTRSSYTLPMSSQQLADFGQLGLSLRKVRENWSFHYAFIPAQVSEPVTTFTDPLIRLQFLCWNPVSIHTMRGAVEVQYQLRTDRISDRASKAWLVYSHLTPNRYRG
jgi:hypothetical protein